MKMRSRCLFALSLRPLRNPVFPRCFMAVVLLMTITTYTIYNTIETEALPAIPRTVSAFLTQYKKHLSENNLELHNALTSGRQIHLHYYNPPSGFRNSNVLKGCSSYCSMSFGEVQDYYDKDVVVFFGPNLKVNPVKKRKGQVWVLDGREPPPHFQHIRRWRGLFNWTMTYRRDSDISNMYGVFKNSPNQFVRFRNVSSKFSSVIDSTRSLKPKGKLASTVWVVSNCNTQGRREQYVKTLNNTHSVDIYGLCGTHKCTENSVQCSSMFNEKYKFYLSFENSLCRDYISEKSFKLYTKNVDVIPITRGFHGTYSLYLPPKSFIDTSHYNGIGQLGHFLNDLGENRTEYMQYFQWRKHYQAEFDPMYRFCDLCNRMHNTDVHTKYHRVYHDIDRWVFGSPNVTICTYANDLQN